MTESNRLPINIEEVKKILIEVVKAARVDRAGFGIDWHELAIFDKYAHQICQLVRAETLKEVGEWGETPCIEHTQVKWPIALGGGTVSRQKIRRRRCQHCWSLLKQGKLKP